MGAEYSEYYPSETTDDYKSTNQDANTDRDVELGEAVIPAFSNEPGAVAKTDVESEALTDQDIQKRFPKIDGTNADVRAFIQLLLERRGESYDTASNNPSHASGGDVRYLTGKDLHTLGEEELVDIFPESWSPALKKLMANDVGRVRSEHKSTWDKVLSVAFGLLVLLFMLAVIIMTIKTIWYMFKTLRNV